MHEQIDRLRDVHERLLLLLEQQSILAEFSCLALEANSTEQLLKVAPEMAARGLRIAYVKALRYLPDEKQFLIVTGYGWDEDVVGKVKLGADLESPAGFAFATESPVLSNNLGAQDRFRVPKVLVDHGVNSAINVIVNTRQGRWGVFEADSKHPDAFTYEDTNFLYGFANILGIALSNADDEEQ
ncbi:MAG: GAF domain-containing protein [Phycisphaerales bacterium]